jgi:hypothetical protein
MTDVAVNQLDREECLAPGTFVDSDHPAVRDFSSRALAAAGVSPDASDRERAVALFLAVRDGLRYDPYGISHGPESFMASTVAATAANWCVPKAVLLSAACRSVGIPAGLGFADVRNHLQSEKLREKMGTDLFAFHGYSVISIDGEWQKVSSAFNQELCAKFGTKVLAWDGTGDALMHPFDADGNRHMEYVRDRGWHADLPLEDMLAVFAELYPQDMAADGDDDAFVTD